MPELYKIAHQNYSHEPVFSLMGTVLTILKSPLPPPPPLEEIRLHLYVLTSVCSNSPSLILTQIFQNRDIGT